MQINISKTLSRHLELGCYKAQNNGSKELSADMSFFLIIKEGMSHASHILQKLLKDWEIYQLTVRLEHDSSQPISEITVESGDPDLMFVSITASIKKMFVQLGLEKYQSVAEGEEYTINSGHFMLWLLRSQKYIASRQLELYGVNEERIMEYLSQMPADEDYYIEMALLDKLSKFNITQQNGSLPRTNGKIEPNGFGVNFELESDNNDDDEDNGFSGPQATAVKSKTKRKSSIDKFGINLSHAASQGVLDPMIGRELETDRLIQILSRRKKNNPILIGEAGVGKSAIVEGLANRIAKGNVPQALYGKEVFSLDMASLVAGTKYRGEFEQRIKSFLKEVNENKNIILFIDEIHTIAGAGSTSGSLDTANILKPALARGEIQCIGATTLDEYREHIEKDSALERRFQPIVVEPTTNEQTLVILHNIKDKYEQHHNVKYTDEALRACVDLTERYISNRNFPDKAIDAMDEAGSKAHLSQAQEPDALKQLRCSLRDAEAAFEASSKHNNIDLQIEILALKNRISELNSQWHQNLRLNPVTVGVEHIEAVVTAISGVPIERISQDEQQKLGNMQEHLSGLVVGQQKAVDKVTRSIRRSRVGLADPSKPIGVFMFVGPTGVGKTHLAQELSKWMFDDENSIIRIDMSEYSEKHSISRLIGSPPGYVGYNEGGQLTEAVRRQPYSVVLFDEIEKAHPDMFNLMLQVFDDGHLTDGNGRKVDFRNTVIIMTSNVGTQEVLDKPNTIGYSSFATSNDQLESRDSEYRGALSKRFTPEFLNRIDDIVVFNTLSLDDIERIVGLELEELAKRAESLGYNLNISSKACKQLALMGYQPQYGARSLKRKILQNVEEPLAELILNGELRVGDGVRVVWKGNEIKLTTLPKAQ